jgi:hypothetical protein
VWHPPFEYWMVIFPAQCPAQLVVSWFFLGHLSIYFGLYTHIAGVLWHIMILHDTTHMRLWFCLSAGSILWHGDVSSRRG